MNTPSAKSRAALLRAVDRNECIAMLSSAEAMLEALSSRRDFARLVLIDPPYNRRTSFHHYSDSICRDAWAKTRTEHCASLYALLEKEGSLWMHIDDAELCSAKAILDRIFGAKNCIATVVWQKSISRDNRMGISTTHEYILAYAKDKKLWTKARNKLSAGQDQLGRYSNPDDDPRGPWTSGDLTAKAGPGRRESQFYDLVTPSGRVVTPSKGTAWRFTRERMDQMIAENRIYFGSGNRVPRLKRFLSETGASLVPNTWWPGEEVGTADSAKRHLKAMFPGLIPFETPKPEELAARIINISTNPGDTVIDIYGGSGTTAAVSQKLGRRWITCEREDRTFYEFLKPRLDLVVSRADTSGIEFRSDLELAKTYRLITS